MEQPTVFLSYARKDTAIVRQLYKTLALAGYDPWMDIEDILPGQNWEKRILWAIQKSPIFLACLSHHSVDRRGMIQVELKEALNLLRQKLDEDIYLIPVRLEECIVPEALSKFHWVDFFQEEGTGSLMSAIRFQLERLGISQKHQLRSKPIGLASDDFLKMLAERGFFDLHRNWKGQGILHQYEVVEKGEEKAIIDHTSGLQWQKGGSESSLLFDDALLYVADLNQRRFLQRDDWRLPTLEEAMSILEPAKSKHGLFVSSIFDKTQTHIWTADYSPDETSEKWVVQLFSGFSALAPLKVHSYVEYVRAVCTWHSETR